MKKYLITGGAGFIGSNYLHLVVNQYQDRQFYCMDNFTYAGNFKNIEGLMDKENFSLIVADISDKPTVDRFFEDLRFDVVINFAAESHVDRSISDASLFLKTNIIGTYNLLEASRRFGCSKFHQVSTDEVYGELELDRPDLKFTEINKLSPSSPYSASKTSADLFVMAYYRTYKLPITISRCSNNYGPYQFPEKLIPLMTLCAINGQKLPVDGNGLNVRDWIHVYDHCTAIDIILDKGSIGEIYNIGGNEELNNISVVKKILNYLRKGYDLIEYVEDRKGHDLRYAIDSSKIESLGWVRQYNFEFGLSETIEWYKKNHDWISNVSAKYDMPYGRLISSSDIIGISNKLYT
jgi:dTDP-glucose 4,6-dehydratase